MRKMRVLVFALLFATSNPECLRLQNFKSDEDVAILSEGRDLLLQCVEIGTTNARGVWIWDAFQKWQTRFKLAYVLLMDACRTSNKFESIIRKIDDFSRTYVIICKTFVSDGDVKEIFSTTFAHGVTAVGIVVNDLKAKTMYSWNPYEEPGQCGKNVTLTVTTLSTAVDIARIQNAEMNLRNCIIRVASIRISPFVINITHPQRPGIYVSVFNTISELTGARILYLKNEELTHEFLNNGTYHQLTQLLQNGSADVGIGRLFMNNTHTTVGPCIYFDRMFFLVRKRKKFSSYRYLFRIFTHSLWLSMVFVFFLSSAVFVISGRCFQDSKIKLYDVLLELFRMYLGTSGKILYKTNNMRILLLFYSLYCLNMNSVYLSKLSSQLSTPDQEKRINHVDVLVRYRVHIYTPMIGERLTFLVYYTSHNQTWLNGGFTVNNTEYEMLQRIAIYQENGTIAFRSTLITFPSESAATTIFKWGFSNGWLLFVTYYLRPNNPLNHIINYWCEEMFEKGFVQKWWYDISRSNINRTYTEEEPVPEAISLKVAHFEEVFYVLITGWLVATVSFLVELFRKFHVH